MPSVSNLLASAGSMLDKNPAGDPAVVLHSFLQGEPAFAVNRERAATVLDAGFRSYDTYAKARPWIFAGSLAGMGVSGFALYKRRSKGSEAVVLWAAMFLASAGTAWVTRPQRAVAAPNGATAQTQAVFSVLGAIDARRMKLKARDPNFADKVIARFTALPVVAAQLDQSPGLKAVVS